MYSNKYITYKIYRNYTVDDKLKQLDKIMHYLLSSESFVNEMESYTKLTCIKSPNNSVDVSSDLSQCVINQETNMVDSINTLSGHVSAIGYDLDSMYATIQTLKQTVDSIKRENSYLKQLVCALSNGENITDGAESKNYEFILNEISRTKYQ